MPIGIARALNIEKNEESSVFILIFQSVFIGIFAGSFDVGAHSLFLSVFDASLIPKAFVVSGVVGILITSVYTRLQSRMKYANFALLNLIFVAIVTALLRLGFEFTDDKRLVFAVFVLMGPLTIISFLGFWGTVGRLFTLRQGKRLFGLIDTGQILGIIVVSFAIPLLIALKFQVLNTLFISTISIILALVLQFIITKRFRFKSIQRTEKRDDNFFSLFRNNYTLLMALFVVFSVVAAFFVHFSFLTVLKENYPDPNAFATFLGAFMGTLTIFTILIKTFIYGKMMKSYGLKLASVISPILLGLFTFIAAIIGSLFGYTLEAASFAFFFLLIVLSKLFAKSLKDSIEVPASKILYQSLDVNIRYNVQARIDGTVNELAAFSSGLLLTGLGMLAFVKIIHFSWFLLIILLIWAYVGFRLYHAYKLSLGSSLEKFQQLKIDEHEVQPLLERIVPGKSDPGNVASVLEFAPQSWNGYVSNNIHNLCNSDGKILSMTLNIIDNLDLKDTAYQFSKIAKRISPEQESRLKNILDRFNVENQQNTEEEIRNLLKSNNPENRKRGLIVILEKNDPRYFPRIVPLFRDMHPSVRIAAIRLAGLLNRKDFITYLVDLLEDPEYYPYAFEALSLMSDDVLESLEHGFHKTGITEKGWVRITRIMALSNTPFASEFLINKLEHINRQVFSVAVKGLQKIRFSPGENDKSKIFFALNRMVGIAAWNLSAKHSLRDFASGNNLIRSFDEELRENYDMIYSLMSLVYDPASIYHIRKNLESGTAEGIGFAIELLDLFVDETVKPFLFPLLDDTPIADKIRLLQSEYPVELLKPMELIVAVLNRDYNQINPYTRVCAIHALAGFKDYHPGKELIAQMFSPDPLLREESSSLVKNLDSDLYEQVLLRLPFQFREDLKSFIEKAGSPEDNGLFKKFSYLCESNLFTCFKNHQILYIARQLKFHIFKGETDILFSDLVSPDEIFLVVDGELKISADYQTIVLTKGNLYDADAFIGSSSINFTVNSGFPARLLILDKSALRELIFDDENTYFPITEMIYPIEKMNFLSVN